MEATMPIPRTTLQTVPASSWSMIVQKKPISTPCSRNVFADCKSSKGISVAVVDASAIIHGDKLAGCADKFVSVREVVEEIRDPVSRQRLTRLPFLVETMEPSPDAIKKVVKFARETGDLQTLSDVDLKLIALTYMLETQIHGTNHLRDSPPVLHVVNVRSLPESQMPGWGDNVPNLAEWEALEQATAGVTDGSKILSLKNLDDNAILRTETVAQTSGQQAEHQPVFKPRKFNFPKREIKIEGKKMVSEGVDASKGEILNGIEDWHPAVSRSTHRRYLKRKNKRESRMEAKGNEHQIEGLSTSSHKDDESKLEFSKEELFEEKLHKNDELEDSNFAGNNLSSALEQLILSDANSEVSQEEEDEDDICDMSENLEASSNTEGSSFVDDSSSLQSLKMRSLSDSTVACITSDYAIQNVILQIGLRLLASGGMQIHQLHRWVLKCHACNNITQEIGKIFCPKCGNGGTLRKVSVTVGENGILLASRKQRIILRGTKFSLPLPQGGRDAITKNLILREDQLPRKLLYPKLKKKSSNKDEEFLCSDDIFSNAGEKRVPFRPPVRKAIAMFSGKRNPNDNHFSRKH